ncbi:MAG: mannose-1-phosphate guanylyltransferase/mannose-6-phosphate isomerase, partial [Comamonadaceae bacterium]|nr:mannose-1-phosphate guanylyltransferase/mannose-6-phosphate isomerase [Comamonadaceae bacterium]
MSTRTPSTITPVVLCGGSGTRLWPLSRQSFPKQFVPLVGERSLLQLTLERLAWCDNPVICVAAEDHRFLVADALGDRPGSQVLLEPAARNTAAAMALAALLAQHGNDDPLLLICPADHHIPDASAFAKTIRQGVPAAEAGAIVTFGVVPSFPSTAYGYIQQGPARSDGSRAVARF